MLICRQFELIELSLVDFLGVSERDLTQENEFALLDIMADILARVGVTLRKGVGEVNALAKGMTGHWCLGRRDSHTLLEDAHEVEDWAAVEEQASVANLALNALCFALALDSEYLELVRHLVIGLLAS
jgi:hypothetical protein